MTDTLHPLNIDGRKQAVRDRDRHRCVNCTASDTETTLDVHHVVPRGRAGSNRLGNMVTLCRQCHDAAHGKAMATRVKFDRGAMKQEEFDLYLGFWKSPLFEDVAIFDQTETCWCVPKSDMERMLETFDERVFAGTQGQQ